MVKGKSFKITLSITLSLLLLFVLGLTGLWTERADAEDTVIHAVYDDENAGGTDDGTSWENAITILQKALDVAESGQQIWVAKGTYYPTSAYSLDGIDLRNKHFQMKNGVAIYGGFAGTEERSFDLTERDFITNETILSGDIGVVGDNSDNSYHVFYHDNLQLDDALLDGFTICDGNASYPNNNGGGMYNFNSSPTVTNVNFSKNTANDQGGGMHNNDSSPTLTNVNFSENTANYFGGGGMCNYNSSPILTDVNFSENTANFYGGGMRNEFSNPTLTNVILSGNTVNYHGGGMFNYYGSPTLTNVIFSRNTANYNGGGMLNLVGSPTLTNVIFSENTANSSGGGMFNRDSNPTIRNSIFWANIATSTGSEIFNDSCSPIISYSLIQGSGGSGDGWNGDLGDDGAGNIDADPMLIGTEDLRLPKGSPAIDAGTNAPYGEDGAAYGVTTDLNNNPRIVNNTVDMGAYEYQICTVTFNAHGGIPAIQEIKVNYGDTIDELPTVSKSGNSLIEWNTKQDGSGTAFTSSTPITADITLYAIWNSYTVTFNVGAGNGTITAVISEEEIHSGDLLAYGSTVTFTATPSSDWKFTRWDIDGTTVSTPVYNLIVESDKTVTAYFKRASSGSSNSAPITKYTLTMEIEGQGTVTPAEGEHKYPAGTSVNLKAAAVEGWEFVQWVLDGETVSNMETEIKLDGSVKAKAVFKETEPKPRGAKEIILTIDSQLMRVNSEEVAMDVAPIIDPQTGRTMVPVRFVSEYLGADVQWLLETKQIKIVLGDKGILLTIGSNKVLVNGEEIEIDCPAEVYGSRTFVPLRFVSEILGAKVEWDGTTRQVTIRK
ncbi:MAG TPA: hypothetical protein DEF34_12485 [Desulfotomaculum sp.]|nr:MAG: hypothetical protein JL56_12895 [Desulfotomaculum sp. BICA1-6]HBX24431.1 hypothetical protein [Desulfotomaculum sp.]